MYSATIGSERYVFPDLKTLLAKASPLRSGDVLAGIAAQSGEERVAAQYALADLPLATFLNAPTVPYETDEVTRLIIDTHDAAAFAPVAHLTVGGLRDWLLSDAATTDALAGLAPRPDAGDGGGGRQDQPAAGPHGDGREMQRGDRVPQHAGAAGPPVGAAAAQSSDRRSARHRGQHIGWPAARLGRRGDRHQSGDRQPGARRCALAHARRHPHQARNSHAKLRAGPCHHDARSHPPRRAGRSGVSIDRRHASRQCELRDRPRPAAGGARSRAFARARHASGTT